MEQKTINLFKKALKSLAPPPNIKPSEWAEQNLVLNESAFSAGRWRRDTVPYQAEIIDAVVDPEIEEIVMMTSSQGGKNVIINIILGYFVDIDPCPIMLIEPSLDLAQDYSKRRLAPLIRDTKCLREKIYESKSRDSNNTILLKLFPGGSINLVGANAPRTLASKPIRVVIGDEIDGFETTKEGDALRIADRRTTTYYNKKKIFASTPLKKGTSRIEKKYLKGTQEKWRLLCPHCGEYEYINWYGIKFQYSKDEKGNYSVWDISYQCSSCMQKFDETTWRNQPGMWVADNPSAKKIRSFHWNGFVTFGLKWDEIIIEYLTTKNDPDEFQVTKNTILGEPYEDEINVEEYDYLLQRREDYGGDLPDGVLLLTAGVDTQDDRLEYEVVGWGRGEESWGIEYGVVMGKPDQKATWDQLSEKLDQTFRFANGTGMKIACAFVDSGGHFTSDVYKFCKKNEHRRIFAIRGMSRPGIPLLHSKARSKKENCLYFNIGVDGGKAKVLSRLGIKQRSDGYCHFPIDERRGYDQIYFKGLISERQVAKKVNGKLRYIWEKIGEHRRNEPLDVRNYAQAAFYLLPVNWDALEKRIKSGQNQTGNPKKPPSTPPKKRYGVVNKGVAS